MQARPVRGPAPVEPHVTKVARTWSLKAPIGAKLACSLTSTASASSLCCRTSAARKRAERRHAPGKQLQCFLSEIFSFEAIISASNVAPTGALGTVCGGASTRPTARANAHVSNHHYHHTLGIPYVSNMAYTVRHTGVASPHSVRTAPGVALQPPSNLDMQSAPIEGRHAPDDHSEVPSSRADTSPIGAGAQARGCPTTRATPSSPATLRQHALEARLQSHQV